MEFDDVAREVEGYVGLMKKIVREILFDQIAPITQTDSKLFDSSVILQFHNVPQYGPGTDLHEWFWLDHSLFRETCAEPACKYYSLFYSH